MCQCRLRTFSDSSMKVTFFNSIPEVTYHLSYTMSIVEVVYNMSDTLPIIICYGFQYHTVTNFKVSVHLSKSQLYSF